MKKSQEGCLSEKARVFAEAVSVLLANLDIGSSTYFRRLLTALIAGRGLPRDFRSD
jgi:hypothetical protein